MMTPLIPFGEWTPDQPELNASGLIVARDVIPHTGHYVPVNQADIVHDALPARCTGSVSVKDSTGSSHWFASTASALYKLVAGSWVDVSRTAGYATANNTVWRFTQYANIIVATNYLDEVQYFNVLSSTEFDDLTTIKARYCAVINNFLVLADVVDEDGTRPNRIRWSALDNPFDFTPSVTTQSDFQDIESTPRITGITDTQNYGVFAVILSETKTYRMEYIGSGLIFSFDVIQEGIGAPYEGLVASFGSSAFFYSNNGFYAVSDGNGAPIGHGKVDRTFKAEADFTKAHQFNTVIDIDARVVYFNYVDVYGLRKQLFFGMADNRWTEGTIQAEAFVNSLTPSTTVDSFTDETVDSILVSVDSASLSGGARISSFFQESTHNTMSFNQLSAAAVIETADVKLGEPNQAYISGLGITTDATDITVSLGCRNSLSDAVTYASAAVRYGESQLYDTHAECRYQRVKLTTTGDYKYLKGYHFEYSQGGFI